MRLDKSRVTRVATKAAKGVVDYAGQWCSHLLDVFVVVPAARWLPKGWALALADGVGFYQLVFTPAGRTARKEMKASTGLRGWQAWVCAGHRLAGAHRELVYLKRLRCRREDPSQWRLLEVNFAPVQEMLASGRPFLIAAGHFYESAQVAVKLLRIPSLPGNSVAGAVPAWRPTPYVFRERLVTKLNYGLTESLAGVDYENTRLPRVGEGDVQGAILERLARPGGVVRIPFDALWDRPNAYKRPFAGMAERGFALGVARIARLAQCPIVSFVTVFEGTETVRIEWGPVVPAPPADDKESDTRTLDCLLDWLEGAVGRYPTHYLHPIGFDRHWNAASGLWERGSPD